MAPLMYLGFRKVLFLFVVLLLFVSLCFSACSEPQSQRKRLSSTTTTSTSTIRRKMLELESETEEEEYEQSLKKKKPTKNNTKLINPNTTDKLSSKNQTKTIKSNNNNNLSSKNQTKLSSKTTFTDTHDLKIKKLNSTTTIKTKKLNSTSKLKPSTNSSKSSTTTMSSNTTSSNSTKSKSLDLLQKTSGSKNKTTKATSTNKDNNKEKKINLDHQTQTSSKSMQNKEENNNKKKKQGQPSWMFEEGDDDLDFSELKDLPIKFQQTLLPDLERISKTSQLYITKANKEISKGFKPYVGNKYAPFIATLLSCAFALVPLLFVSLLFNRIKSYFTLQKLLIFIQAYISIYFFILCLSSLVTGLEPLRFFYATSQSTYLCLQVLQTLAYVLYLFLLLMYLVLVFSTDCGLGSRFLGLAQTFVGFSIGLHYYVTVFHRVVLKQPPKTNWKMHGIYATCFFLICFLANADRRKKTYLEEGGEEGKKN